MDRSGVWRWAIPAAVGIAAVVAAVAGTPRLPRAVPPLGSHVRAAVVAQLAPAPTGTPLTALVTQASARGTTRRVAQPALVEATSTPRAEGSARPDPLEALVRAVQDIPEDAWNESLARANAPVAVPPIVVPRLVTPPIIDAHADPNAPGEP